jgi:hypothetical protein
MPLYLVIFAERHIIPPYHRISWPLTRDKTALERYAREEWTMYYIFYNAAQTEPFQLGEIDEMLQKGEVSPQALFWTERMPEWKPIGEFRLTSHLPPSPALPPSAQDEVSDEALAAEHIRIYTIARYQRIFCFAFLAWLAGELAFLIILLPVILRLPSRNFNFHNHGVTFDILLLSSA